MGDSATCLSGSKLLFFFTFFLSSTVVSSLVSWFSLVSPLVCSFVSSFVR